MGTTGFASPTKYWKNTKRFWNDFYFNLIKVDPDDNKFVDCAIAGNAKFIVTEDRHYDILQQIDFPKVNIIRLDEMMQNL